MGALGGPEAVRPLLDIAAGVNAAHRELAAAALANLRGKGVDAALVRALDVPAAQVQAAAIRALTARRGAVSLDRLLAMAQSGPKPAAAAALEALRQMGRPADLKPLLDLMMARPADEREPVAAAWLDIARRSAGDTAGTLAEERLKAATKREDRIALLDLLGQLGGDRALAALTAAAKDSDPEVRLSAVRALAEWPDARPMALLLATVKENPSARLRAVAMRGYLRCLGLPGGPDAARASELYVEALGLATSPDEKRLVLSGMATVGSPRLLDMAVSLTADPELRSEAEQAAYSICHLTAGAWPDETRQALQKLAADAADPDLRTRARALLDTMAHFGDFVMAWEVSPAYAQEGADFSKLFEIAFPPEDPAHEPTVGWRVMPVGMSAEQPWLLDLLAVHGGEQKVAYLRTAVWSETDRDIVAEIGTDDGLKVWWNGTLVCSNNTQRAVAPAQEKVQVHARAGWNRMLLKVTQNVMGWGACVRFVAPDGSPARGLRLALPSFAPENEAGGATSTASGK
jgi:HEAT repeat protein